MSTRVPPDLDALDEPVRVDEGEGITVARNQRIVYRTTGLALSAVMALAVLDGVGVVDAFGIDDAHAVATADGYELDVRYTTVSRSGIASPLEFTIRRSGGFDGPVGLALEASYLAMWDENGLDPDPSSSTATDERVIWYFDPPPGEDVLVVSFDGRIEPAAQWGSSGRAAVVDDDGEDIVAVEFSTAVRP